MKVYNCYCYNRYEIVVQAKYYWSNNTQRNQSVTGDISNDR